MLSKATWNESQCNKEGDQDEPPTVQINATESKIICSESLRGQGLLGGVEPNHDCENHHVACRKAKADTRQFLRIIHASSKDLICDSKGVARQISKTAGTAILEKTESIWRVVGAVTALGSKSYASSFSVEFLSSDLTLD